MHISRVEVVAAVIVRDGKFLLCQRPLHKKHGGMWEFPGGKLEPGETLLQAAQRELIEELAMQVDEIGEIRLSTIDPLSDCMINFVDVKCSGQPKLIEHIAVEWVALEKICELSLAPSDQKFVEHMELLRICNKLAFCFFLLAIENSSS